MGQFFKFLFASCLGTFLALGALFVLLIFMGVASASLTTTPPVKSQSVLEIKLNYPVPEQTNNTDSAPLSLDLQDVLGLHEIIHQIDRAVHDDNIKGIYIESTLYSLSPASTRQMMEALNKFKESGKFVVAYGEFFSQGSYQLASIADTIFLNPIGSVDFRGFASYMPFYKDLLDKTGIKMQIYYAGQFKSASEPFRRNNMSEQSKLQTREFLSEVYDGFLEDIAKARALDKDELFRIANNLLSTNADAARDLGLVDVIGYQDEVFAWMQKHLGNSSDKKPNLISLNDFYLNDNSASGASSARVAVVYAQGPIVHGKAEYGVISDGNYGKVLADLRNSNLTKAVVLRVNSPGGSILASENILREVRKLRDAGKPVVVSMGDYAASGGYYISCEADRIFAEEQTLTGSIGVFTMVPNPHAFLDEKIGIQFDTVRTGAYSSSFTPYFGWSDEENNFMKQRTDEYYQRFLQKVADGREMPIEDVDRVAQGRIWSGSRAQEHGLVDSLGDMSDAIASAADLAGLSQYRVAEYPKVQDPLMRMINEIFGMETAVSIDRYLESKLDKQIRHFQYFRDVMTIDEPLVRLPMVIEY